jgi:hypothetical protein
VSIDVELPAFAMDCRQWLVATESDGLIDDVETDLAVLAVLSTAMVDGAELRSATAILSLALIPQGDEGVWGDGRGGFSPDLCLADADWATGHARYVVPAPRGDLALVAEFACDREPPLELVSRFHELLASFRWAA